MIAMHHPDPRDRAPYRLVADCCDMLNARIVAILAPALGLPAIVERPRCAISFAPDARKHCGIRAIQHASLLRLSFRRQERRGDRDTNLSRDDMARRSRCIGVHRPIFSAPVRRHGCHTPRLPLSPTRLSMKSWAFARLATVTISASDACGRAGLRFSRTERCGSVVSDLRWQRSLSDGCNILSTDQDTPLSRSKSLRIGFIQLSCPTLMRQQGQSSLPGAQADRCRSAQVYSCGNRMKH